MAKWMKWIAVKTGPVSIKFMQVLSMRTDLLSEVVCKELRTLQEHVPLETSDERILQILKESGAYSKLRDFAIVPLAVGSVGQVHTAFLAENDKKVAIKFIKPNTEENVGPNLQFLRFMTKIIYIGSTDMGHRLELALNWLDAHIREQFDLRMEAGHLTYLSAKTKYTRSVLIPHVYEQLSNKNVMVMDFVEGGWYDTYSGLSQDEKNKITFTLIGFYLASSLRYGVIHCDLHGGNVRITPDRRLAIFDFGLAKKTTFEERKMCGEMLVSCAKGDYARASSFFINQLVYFPPTTSADVMEEARKQVEINFSRSITADRFDAKVLNDSQVDVYLKYNLKNTSTVFDDLALSFINTQALVSSIGGEQNVWKYFAEMCQNIHVY